MFRRFPRLRCAIHFGKQEGSLELELVLFDMESIGTIASLVKGVTSLVFRTVPVRRRDLDAPVTFKTLHLALDKILSSTADPPTESGPLRPVCDILQTAANMEQPLEELQPLCPNCSKWLCSTLLYRQQGKRICVSTIGIAVTSSTCFAT